jgi:outer membrane protein TolC
MKKCQMLAILMAVFVSTAVYAETSCQINGPQDILDCALQKHPDVVNAEREKDRDQKLLDIAKQRPNPELESSTLFGKTADDTNPNTQTALLAVFELGGKRKARTNQADVLGQKSRVVVQENKEKIALQTVLALYRLRQIRAELSQVNEAISTFHKVLIHFKSRPRLAPEQEVAAASFELAHEEYKLKKVSLIQEQSNLSYFLELSTGNSFDQIKNHLPIFRSQWPAITPSVEIERLGNSALTKAKLDRDLARANMNLAKAKAWPDLRIGPVITTETLNSGAIVSGDTIVTGGVGLVVPIPILNRNQGEKSFARMDQQRAETNLDLTIRKTEVERALQQQRYAAAIKALQQTQSLGQYTAKHSNMDTLFERGLVPSTLVTETHRQMYEIIRTRNEQELTGIDALWRIYIIDGKVLDSKI